MADVPQTKDWKAYENRQPGPDGPSLLVLGKVKITSTNQKPHLTEVEPQGPVSQDLILDLAIKSEGAGIEPTEPWVEARFERKVSQGQFTSVTIRSGGEIIATTGVTVVQ
jgi:hypothetical protein